MKVSIIGGGLVGSMTAYALPVRRLCQRRGHTP
jgi:hypothetical protein